MRNITRALYFFIVYVFSSINLQAQDCECTNCPQFMPDNFTGDFLITVQNATNNTLGQNGQGVCGVVLNFDHEYIGDLLITLTSPAGQTVTLVGPIGLFGPTDGSIWNVTFVPCGDPANPDPGFSAQWNNNQPWGLFGNYNGSYYPAAGCLENFNSGPVNGTWSLTVTDGQSNDVGNFYDYEIIFCDPSGILCFSCAAEAGNLTQPDISACEGSQSLVLDLPPTFTANEPQPPATEYSYTYIIAGPGGVIQAYEINPDLSGYLPGNYTVCGMSYYSLQEAQIPQPNGSLTIQQLSTQLASSNPPFCGDITNNCVNVTIFPGVPNEEEFASICSPDCYLFLNQSYCQPGTYVVDRLSPDGCPFTSTLYLEVLQPSFTTINETACENTCAQTPGFETICDPGQYQVTYSNAVGCDSIVTLNFNYLIVNAVIAPPPPFPCTGGAIQLSGSGSTVGGGTTYLWTASNGGNIVGPANGLNVQVDAPGDYQLRVCRTAAGAGCCDSTSVTVVGNQNPPPAPTSISGPAVACADSLTIYTVAPVPGADSYTWTVPDSVVIVSGQGTDTLQVIWAVADSGTICVQASNTCGSSPQFCISALAIGVPGAAVLSGDTIACPGDTLLYTLQTPGDSTVTGYFWTVDSLGSIVSGQGSDSLWVVWQLDGTGQICYAAQNTCGSAPLQCQNVQIGALPPQPDISGPVTACAGSSVWYTTTPVGAAFTYDWQVAGGIIAGGNGADSLLVQWNAPADSGVICLTLVSSCGLTPAVCLTVMLSAAPDLPIILGDTLLCAGGIGSYSIAPINGASGYDWTISGSGAILSGQNTTAISVDWPAAPGGNICIAAISGCGTGPQACLPVTVPEVPTANAGQDTALCGNTATLSAIPSITGSTGSWIFLSGPGTANIANPNNAATAVTVIPEGSYTFLWTETNSICSDNDTVQVNFNTSPQVINIVRTCDGTNTNYTVSFEITGGAVPFLMNGELVNTTQYTSSPIPSGQSYSFNIQDANGCSASPVTGSFNCACTTNAGSMANNLLEACVGDSVQAVFNNDATLDADDIIAFVLHTGNGPALGAVLAQNSSGIFGLAPGMAPETTYYISVVAGSNLNGVPDTSDPCFSVTVGQPVVFHDFPAVSAGVDTAVCAQSLTLNGNSGTGSWAVLNTPAGGILNIANPSSAQSTVQASTPGLYALSWTRVENGCSAADTVEIQFYEIPIITGFTEACDSANEFFTVTLLAGGGTLPYSINGQPLVSSPFISAPIPSGQSYSFQLTDANGCQAPPVTGAFICNCTTNAGSMSATPLQACQGTTVTASANNDMQLDGNDTFAFVLHDGTGNALGQVFDQNQTGIFGWVPGMIPGNPYYISRVAGNENGGIPDPADPCFTVSIGQPVVFLAIPVPNAGTDAAFCGTSGLLSAGTSPYPGSWTIAGGPASAVIDAPAANSSTVTAAQTGQYLFVWTETNVICSASDTVQLTFNTIPSVMDLQEVCDSVNTAYQVVVLLNNNAAPVASTGLDGQFANNTFTSIWLPTGSSYNFTITDTNGCTSAPISGAHSCDCATNAGSMNTNLQVFCAGDTATGAWNNDASTDPNDILQFILHDQAGPIVGNIIATAAQPSFPFGPGVQTGVTYYISAIAGNGVNGSVDLTDPCFSVAAGTPVQWRALPTAGLSGEATICSGDSTELIFSGTGSFPLTVQYLDPDGNAQNLVIPGPAPVIFRVNPGTTGTYQLLSVSENVAPFCSNTADDMVQITVNQALNAGQPLPAPEFCADTAIQIDLTTLLSNQDAGGFWNEVSAVPSTGSAFNAANGIFLTVGQSPGLYRFRYALDAQAPCPDPSAIVEVRLHPVPVADAGPDRSLSCLDPEVQIGGNSSTGPGITYEWRVNGDPTPISGQALIQVQEPGNYTLSVQNTFGCNATDAVSVDNISTVPEAILRIRPIRCFGEENGLITVEPVGGGTPPLRYSLNGGAFGPSPVFDNLSAGTYQIILQDAFGCEWISDTVYLDTPPELTADLGDDIEVLLGEAANIQLSASVPVSSLDTIVWTPLPDSTAAGQPNLQFTPLRSMQIKVRIEDPNGCEASDEILVRVDRGRRVYVPNIFNPDLGGLTVYGGTDVLEIEQFRIFDRWGGAVFEQGNFQPNNPAEGWQGVQRGEPVNPGVYAWYAVIRFIDGASETFTGDVTVYR